MANVSTDSSKGQNIRLGLLAAGMFGVVCASLLGRTLQPDVHPAPANLTQAISEFDSGALSSGVTAFRDLAAKGDANAAYWYGHALDFGLGTPENATDAIAQYEKAWTGGVVPAGTRLGELYLEGNKVAPDFVKAHDFLSQAAARGDGRAAFDYGRMLRDGIGGAANPVSAYAWMEVASLRGVPQADGERDKLLTALSPAQQNEAAQEVATIQAKPAEPALAKVAAPLPPKA